MRILVIFTVTCLLLAMAGCSQKSTSPDAPDNTLPLAQQVPAEILETLEANTPDELVLAPTDDNAPAPWPNYEDIEDCDIYAVTFLWGSFGGPPATDISPTNWAGQLSVNGVAVVHPRMAIDFEPETDSILTEDLPHLAAWDSQTANDFDGISFLVFLKRGITYFAAPLLTFETEPITLSYDFGKLIKLNAFYMLEPGKAVAVHARKIWPPRCPGGFMDGKWIKEDNGGREGRFEGVWKNYRGEPAGYMNGTFWTNNDGRGEFEGWVSGYYTDHIIAEMKGAWWYDDPRMCLTCGQGHGWFRGHFTYATEENRGGRLAGEFGHFGNPTVDQNSLPFHGVWHDFCPWSSESIGNSSGND